MIRSQLKTKLKIKIKTKNLIKIKNLARIETDRTLRARLSS